MKSISLDLDRELASLDPPAAQQFKQAVQAMLRLVMERQQKKNRLPFSERVARHPAIGTWPSNLNADQHIAKLRNEWER